MENQIKDILQHARDIEATKELLNSQLSEEGSLPQELKEQLRSIDDCLSAIHVWMTLLTEDEAYVVQRHLIDGVDMPRITSEYREKWGPPHARSERTLKSYQHNALRKIELFEAKRQRMLSSGLSVLGKLVIEGGDV